MKEDKRDQGKLIKLRNEKFKSKYEYCVICGKRTDVKREDPVGLRRYYVEGVGQLCEECFEGFY